MTRWALPEYIADVLPAEARRVEHLRRALLDAFRVHGYELVMPPLLEYLDSLMTGTGHDMDLRTFKLVDQLSGRTMGLRADITPQAARIDAHLLNRAGVTRLAYCGPVLHALPQGLNATREPLQIGAEIYGHAGIEADVEIQNLLLHALEIAVLTKVRFDVGHVGVFRALAEMARLEVGRAEALFAMLQAKDIPALRAALTDVPGPVREALLLLPRLYGGVEILERAERELPHDDRIRAALGELRTLTTQMRGAQVSIDLAELRGYQYHSGVVFAAYCDGLPNAIARGGRYDEVGKSFGRARPATGFSLDLKELAGIAPGGRPAAAILVPLLALPAQSATTPESEALRSKIAALRAAGEVVVPDLPGHDKRSWQPPCDRELVWRDDVWTVQAIS